MANEKECILHRTQGLVDSTYEITRYVERLKEMQERLSSSGVALAFLIEKVVSEGYENTTASEEELGAALVIYLSYVTAVASIRKRLEFYVRDRPGEEDVVSEVTMMVNAIAKRPR